MMKNNKIMHDISYGMYVVASSLENKNVGCTINALCQITNEKEPIITISLNKDNYTNKIIKETKRFSVSILSEKTNPNLISTFGFSSSQVIDKFRDFAWINVADLPIINEHVTGYLIGEVINIIDCSTHDLFIARVISGDKLSDEIPMTYRYYHEVIKGKAPVKAPTYVADETPTDGQVRYRCPICGYIHEGNLPADFNCPICQAPSTIFEKV